MLRIVQLLAVVAVVSASVIKESDEDSISAEINVNSNYILALNRVFLSSKIGPIFLSIAYRTTDHDCVDKHIKKFNLTQKLADLIEVEYDELSLRSKQELSEIVWKPLRLCSSKFRSISDTAFDILMSFGHIVRAFKDEPEFARIMNAIKCANGNAIEQKLIDPSNYPLAKFSTEKEELICTEIENMYNAKMQEYMLFLGDSECMRKVFDDTGKLLLRILSLLQVELTPEQHKNESERFFGDIKKIYEIEGSCGDTVDLDLLCKEVMSMKIFE